MNRSTLFLASALVLAAGVAKADDLKATARGVATKSSKAVVTAKLVINVSVNGQEREVKREITGTVIDSSGLTVVSAAAIEPTAGAFGGGGRRGGGGGGGGGGQAPQIEAEVSETALVLEDGSEVEAEVVLKDAELDLAFIRPKDKSAKLDYVELKQQDKAPQVLDDIFTVGRLGRVGNRAISVTAGSIKSVVKGPRSFYVTDDAVSSGATGCLAYAADGTPIGVFVTKVYRPAEAAGGGGGMRGGRGGGEAIAVVRSINDVIELAKQAKTAKAPEKKDGAQPEKKSDDQPKSDEKPKAPEKKKDDKKSGDDF
jgi:hypothetical protein